MKPGNGAQDPVAHAQGLHRRGRTKEAESLYRKLIAANARNHRALSSLGVLLCETGRSGEAVKYLERAVTVELDPMVLTNLGAAYRICGRLDLAAECFGRILEIEPNFPDARLNLALILADAGVHQQALPLLELALRFGPDSPRLRTALSRVALCLHRPEQARNHALRGVELAPNLASVHRQLGDVLDAHGEKAAAVARYRRAIALDPSDHRAHSDLIIAMLSMPEYDPRELYVEARNWAKRHAAPMRQHVRQLANGRDPERRLRIGYVSPDFRTHAIQQFLVPLLEQHDPAQVEIYLYSAAERPDAVTDWYRTYAGERFRDIRLIGDVEAAELVRSDRIDILVDLALHSVGNRLRVFACRAAPVQMSWLGYMGTTGLETMDYRITDPLVDPPGSDLGIYTESCLHLPETLWCYSALDSELAVSPLPALESGHVTFGSQNTFRKLHPGVYALWARVLRAVPGSRLYLYAEAHAEPRVLEAFASEGVARERIDCGGRVSRVDYLKRYANTDIGLDTFPFSGATTNMDAAWMGVPVVTLSGNSPLQRAGSSIATHLGLPELIANTEDAFVEAAVALTRDLHRLSALRQQLRARLATSPLGDIPRFARNLEGAFRSAWRNYCAATEGTH